ncbi:MAG: hypothetical protein GX166_13915 [Clostridiaceae bacterium]|nr:hypothetical protein [Clostridiaceae bacterium]
MNNGVFIRAAEMPEVDGKTVHFYDSDGIPPSGSWIYTSGLSIVFKHLGSGDNPNPSLRLNFKSYDDNTEQYPMKVNNQYVDISLPEGTNLANFHDIKITDDGTTIEIFFDNQKLATITMSDVGSYPDDIPHKDVEFYKKAVVKDANGNELANYDNVRLAKSSVICFASRNAQPQNFSYNLDNVVLTIEKEDAPQNPETSDALSIMAYVIFMAFISVLVKRRFAYN